MKRRIWPEADLLNKSNNDLDISWSSSSSDNDDKLNFKYRKKTTGHNMNSTKKLSMCQLGEVTPSKSDYRDLDGSPIVGKTLWQELSPCFNENSCDANKSPVIGKNTVKKKHWKKHINTASLVNVESFCNNSVQTNDEGTKVSVSEHSEPQNNSKFLTRFISSANSVDYKPNPEPEISNTELEFTISQYSDNDVFSQQSQMSIDCISVNNSQARQCTLISQFSNTQAQQPTLISQFSNTQESQNYLIQNLTESSNEVPIINSNENPQTPSSDKPVLYYRKVPKKKRYKRGGLASQLQKALRNKRATISIWKHELYLNKFNQGEEFVHLKVSICFKEFQFLLCECNYINAVSDIANDIKCIVVFDCSVDGDINCSQKFKLYKPYSVTKVDYSGKNVCCYYNICKILLDQ